MRRLTLLSLNNSPRLNKGAALLVILFLILAIFSTVLVSKLSANNLEIQRQQKTAIALAQAKEALIAWSVMNGDNGTNTLPRPGTLPCPEDPLTPGRQKATCTSTTGSSLGRLPWKTLGIDELRDAQGEPLWYSVSNNFRPAPPNYRAINSDTQGSIQLYAEDGTTLLTPPGEELAAIIIAPGPPLNGQDRVLSPNTPTSFLDSGNGRNNTIAAGPFIKGIAKDAQGQVIVNDLVIGLRANELISAIEVRALKEAQNALNQHLINVGKFPNPARPNGINCTSSIADVRTPNTCNHDSTTCFGRLPEDSLSSYGLADWFKQNGWGRLFTYAVNQSHVLDGSGAGCSTALNVDGQIKRYILIAPGSPVNGRIRPSLILQDYLEDNSNSDGWNPNPDFSTPSTISNDKLWSIP